MIYKKTGVRNPGVGRYHNVWEYMFVLSNGQPPRTFNPINDRPNKTAGQKRGSTKRGRDGRRTSKPGTPSAPFGRRFNIWEYQTGQGHTAPDSLWKQHAAVMPLRLAVDHVRSWSDSGDVVFDPFAGSGQTIIAARGEGRQGWGCDNDPAAVKLANARVRLSQDRPLT